MKKAETVEEAIMTRKTVRAFLDKPVPEDLVRQILKVSSRAPSGGNLQPWHVHVLAGEVRDELVARVIDQVVPKSGQPPAKPQGEGSEYHVYPPDLTEPYRTRRREVGQDMYNLLGVPKEDTAGKLKQFARNFQFFDAPVGLIFTIDKQMQQGQFVDLGLFMGNIMLLARQHGLDTCPQEAWAIWPNTIRELLDIPESELVFCGMGLGWADDEALINSLETKRADVDEFALFHGFETVKAAE